MRAIQRMDEQSHLFICLLVRSLLPLVGVATATATATQTKANRVPLHPLAPPSCQFATQFLLRFGTRRFRRSCVVPATATAAAAAAAAATATATAIGTVLALRCCVAPCPLNCGAVVFFSVCHVLSGYALHERVLRVAVGEQRLDRQQNLGHCQGGTPLVLQHVEANGLVVVVLLVAFQTKTYVCV